MRILELIHQLVVLVRGLHNKGWLLVKLRWLRVDKLLILLLIGVTIADRFHWLPKCEIFLVVLPTT